MLNKKNIFLKLVFYLFLFFVSSNIFATSFYYDISKKTDSSSIATVALPDFKFESTSQFLMEPTTGKILYANNENERLLPASVTKIMSLLLIMEQIDLGKLSYTDMVVCSAKSSKLGGSQIWFKDGEKLSIDEALKAICVVSANDVTYAMAELIGGSEENFVKMMNDKVSELKLENTHFVNCHGIDDGIEITEHYTSAKDLAIISQELINKHPNILKYTSIWMDSLRGGTFGLTNTNKLIRFYDGATGLKTGSTSRAKFNLVSTATRNDTTYIAVVMKAPSSAIRQEESKQLLDYGFSMYQSRLLCEKNRIIDSKNINKNINKEYEIIVENDIRTLINKGTKLETIENIIYNENIIAPIIKGKVIGKIYIIDKATNEKIGESNLTIKEDILKSSYKDYLKRLFEILTLKIKWK